LYIAQINERIQVYKMKSKQSFTKTEAEEIIKLIKGKLKAESTKQPVIRNKIRKIGFYAGEYGFTDCYTVEQFLSVTKIEGGLPKKSIKLEIKAPIISREKTIPKRKPRSKSDESYIIDLCNEVLRQKVSRQHRFGFLKGDSGTQLPVDAFYPSLNLIIEFKEKQHTEEVKFLDKRQTVSGVGRGEQRKIYDQRRRDVLPMHGIKLIEFDYSDFSCSRGKKLLRNLESDRTILRMKFDLPI